ncbi:hypothetical protein [Erythrobacter sp. R86502]|uniref:hypothetical protein n=1 Tax=Erythrobacter sp. R86502 TaxID=3093846 RepID=UPI0036D4160D
MSDEIERPTGDKMIPVAWLCLVGSVMSGGLGLLIAQAAQQDAKLASSEVSYFAEEAARGFALAAHANTVSWTLFYMFIAFICTGYILRALSFLPANNTNSE